MCVCVYDFISSYFVGVNQKPFRIFWIGKQLAREQTSCAAQRNEFFRKSKIMQITFVWCVWHFCSIPFAISFFFFLIIYFSSFSAPSLNRLMILVCVCVCSFIPFSFLGKSKVETFRFHRLILLFLRPNSKLRNTFSFTFEWIALY